jgi:hypothetical protein
MIDKVKTDTKEIVFVDREAYKDFDNFGLKKGDRFYLGFHRNGKAYFYDVNKNRIYPTNEHK